MADILTHEVFASLLKTKFSVEVDDTQQVEMELDEVSDQKLTTRQEQFSIVFRGPSEIFLGQGIRRLNHERMGPFELFLVPISQDANGYCYESVFNRIRNQEAAASD